MDFGITFPSYIEAWKHAQIAEDSGFSHAWFYDSQLLYSDVYATMALAAEHTSRLKLGTLVAIPSNRIAPVTASAIATINYLAPGRVILGLGTGFTGRNTMGLPAVPVRQLKEYVRQVRGLLDGEDVLFREGERERWIRLLHADRERGFLNLDDPIPIYLAATGPRALAAVGEVGEGWITAGAVAAESYAAGFEAIASAAKAADRDVAKPYTTILTMGCILKQGEAYTSPRVIQRVGWATTVGLHAAWESAHGGVGLGLRDDRAAEQYGRYIDEYAAGRGSPADRRYLEVHEGHLAYVKPGEEAFITEEGIRRTLTGPAEEIVARLKALEAAGVDNLAIQCVAESAEELIQEFSRDVISKM